MELSDYQQWIVINQIEAENEKKKKTIHVTKWYCKIWKGSWTGITN